MSWIWTTPGGWLIRSVVGGGMLLLLTWVLIKRTRQPARRQRLGEWGVVAALLLAVLSLGPAWLPVSWLPATRVPESASISWQHARLRSPAKQMDLDKQKPPSPPLASVTPRKERGASFAQLHSESPDSSFDLKQQSSSLERIGMEDRASEIDNEELNNAALPMSPPTSLTNPTPKSGSETQPIFIGTIQDSKLGRTFSSSMSLEWIGSILCITYALTGT